MDDLTRLRRELLDRFDVRDFTDWPPASLRALIATYDPSDRHDGQPATACIARRASTPTRAINHQPIRESSPYRKRWGLFCLRW